MQLAFVEGVHLLSFAAEHAERSMLETFGACPARHLGDRVLFVVLWARSLFATVTRRVLARHTRVLLLCLSRQTPLFELAHRQVLCFVFSADMAFRIPASFALSR